MFWSSMARRNQRRRHLREVGGRGGEASFVPGIPTRTDIIALSRRGRPRPSSARSAPRSRLRRPPRRHRRCAGPRHRAGEWRGRSAEKHEPLEQRVAREPVRAVQPRGGAPRRTAYRPGKRRAAVDVDAHAADQVVRGRRDRDEVAREVEARLAARLARSVGKRCAQERLRRGGARRARRSGGRTAA